ncbi:hypothetical protein AOLI_G00132320 [Acnodon oligacanthus]
MTDQAESIKKVPLARPAPASVRETARETGEGGARYCKIMTEDKKLKPYLPSAASVSTEDEDLFGADPPSISAVIECEGHDDEQRSVC